jgi:hypothetical protein
MRDQRSRWMWLRRDLAVGSALVRSKLAYGSMTVGP